MKALKTVLSLGLVAGLAGCGALDGASRATTGPDGVTLATRGHDVPIAVGHRIAIPLDVVEVRIDVPPALRVSEAQSWYPLADVVWRGEPRGNRLEQVERIFTEAAAQASGAQASGGLTSGAQASGLPVIAEIEVTRFHCVTEKTRNTIGGTHSMQFMLTIRHAGTGEILDGPRLVVADTRAAGGARAIAEDYAGRTQRVVVVERLTEVLHRELQSLRADPERLGLSVAMSAADPGVLVVSSRN